MFLVNFTLTIYSYILFFTLSFYIYLLFFSCIHSHGDGLPLGAQQKANHFKLLFLDVGLVQSMLGISLAAIEATKEINTVAKGLLAEQFVGQHLMYDRPMDASCQKLT